jgi:hypothetical protein
MSSSLSRSLTNSSQESRDVKEKLEELVHWLVKLKDVLMGADADDDREEMERRARLEKFAPPIRLSYHPKLIACRSFDDIKKQSQALLGKGKVAQILDKAQDSQAVVRLIEQLRQAVLIYQVGTWVARAGQS